MKANHFVKIMFRERETENWKVAISCRGQANRNWMYATAYIPKTAIYVAKVVKGKGANMPSNTNARALLMGS